MRPGYKQTEIGTLPTEWSVISLQAACAETITYGIVQCGPHVAGGVPYIRVSDMNTRELQVDGMLRTSTKIAAGFSRSTVQEGDIVYALRGTIGEVRCVGHGVAGANLTQGTARISPNELMASEFLIWALRSGRSKKLALLQAKGSTFREITLADLRRIRVPLPSLAEQQAIATALSDVDTLIEALEELIAKKRHIKQGAMQELLTGKRRLPGFEGEWGKNELGDMVEFLKGKGLPKSEIDPSGPDKCIHYGELFLQYPPTIGTIRSRTKPRGITFRSAVNDVLMPTSDVTPSGLSTASCIMESGVVIGGDVLVMRVPSTMLCGSFLAYVIRQSKQRILQLVTGTTVFHIYGSAMARFEFLAPTSVDEQSAIVDVLDSMDAELDGLGTKLSKLRQIKQGMMRELLTGRIRLV